MQGREQLMPAIALQFAKHVSHLIRESSKRKTIFMDVFVPDEALIAINSFCRAKAIVTCSIGDEK